MTRTILLADDSVTIQKVIELTFMEEDYEVVAASDGDEALERLEEITPDFVIADVHMPGASGIDVCRRSKELHPGVPVLLLVGTFEPFDEAAARAAGADAHLKKPFDSQELLRQVQAMATAAPAPPEAREPAAEAPSAVAAAAEAEADEGASWSFEPVGEASAANGEVAADTWGGVRPEELAAEPEAPFAPAEEPAGSGSELGASEALDAVDAAAGAAQALSDADVDRIARRVVELIGDKAVRDVAWEVVPDLAEILLKARIEELEASVE